ncbi:MAG: YihA family ribosome biogenesis GTP-binding protein [Oscillospiraceae bacterium]|jgi:GTP-binding protein|nr:YihA family ribosome biogenesis GTP-binding protein [Oscillospiraceae bacterium]
MNYHNVSFLASYGTKKQIPASTLPEVAFAGRSNVGKSSLINKLLGRKALARVSSVPGKTVTVNFFNLDGCLHLVDLPGYGYAKVSKGEKARWAELIEGYLLDKRRRLALTVLLVDMRHPLGQLDSDMVNFLIEAELPFLIVLTKADKLKKSAYEERLAAFRDELPESDQVVVIPFSSETGQGVEELRAVLQDLYEYYSAEGAEDDAF